MDLLLLQPGDQHFLEGLTEIGIAPPAGAAAPTRCLPLLSLAQDLKQPPIAAPGAVPAGLPILDGIGCTRSPDGLSVVFYDHCLRGAPLGAGAQQPTMLYVSRPAGAAPAIFLTLALRDARIATIQFQAHPDDPPVESFTLGFSEILWTYDMRRADGTPMGRTFGGWSLIQNRPIASFTG